MRDLFDATTFTRNILRHGEYLTKHEMICISTLAYFRL